MKAKLLSLLSSSFGIFIVILGFLVIYEAYLGFAFYAGSIGAVTILLISLFLLGDFGLLIVIVGTVLGLINMFVTSKNSTAEAVNSTAVVQSLTPSKSIIDSAKQAPENTPIVFAPNSSERLANSNTPIPSVVGDARRLNAEGVRLSKQGNIEQALSVFTQSAQLNPNDGEVLGNLSYSYYQLGNYDQSEQVLNRALNIKPKRGASWILMGQLRSVRGDLSGAVDSLDKYLTYSSRKSAAVQQLSNWANGYGDGANIPVLRQAATQSLANAGY